MRHLSFLLLLVIFVTFLSSTQTIAGKPNRRGFIMNQDGKKCWYNQFIERKHKYFHGDMPGDTGIMTFDVGTCMKNSNTNKMMINNIVTRWYSHSDANFQTRMSQVYKGSLFQKRGICIQSKKYPSIGVAVDYKILNGYIKKVLHSLTISGCNN